MSSLPTRTENTDNAWARDKVYEWVSNVEGMYTDTQRLAAVHPIALGVYVVWVMYGDGERDFTGHELLGMNHALAGDGVARMLLEQANGPRPDSPDNTEHQTRGYVADSLARRDVQNLDWVQLARDLLDVEPGDEDAPDWLNELV